MVNCSMEDSVKNNADAIIFHTRICDEATNSVYRRRKSEIFAMYLRK